MLSLRIFWGKQHSSGTRAAPLDFFLSPFPLIFRHFFGSRSSVALPLPFSLAPICPRKPTLDVNTWSKTGCIENRVSQIVLTSSVWGLWSNAIHVIEILSLKYQWLLFDTDCILLWFIFWQLVTSGMNTLNLVVVTVSLHSLLDLDFYFFLFYFYLTTRQWWKETKTVHHPHSVQFWGNCTLLGYFHVVLFMLIFFPIQRKLVYILLS